jgi:hypothetical protein
MPPITQRCFWSANDLNGWDVPAETKAFLIMTGLPHRLGQSTIEFGIFDDRHVIGCDYEFPIIVASDGSVWCQRDEGEPAFMNSSVMHLSRFIELSDTFDAGCLHDACKDIGIEIDQWHRQLADTDPKAITHSGAVWPQIVDDARLTLT